MKKDVYYKRTEEMLKNYTSMIHIKKLVDLELEEAAAADHIDKLKYLRKNYEIIMRKMDIAINSMSDEEYCLFNSLYINKEKPISIMCKLNVSKSTYYDLREKLIFKVSEIIYPKGIRDMYESHLF